ncbi:MAG: hypothetical protein ACR2KQ_04055 [Actinomycetota bacterium]
MHSRLVVLVLAAALTFAGTGCRAEDPVPEAEVTAPAATAQVDSDCPDHRSVTRGDPDGRLSGDIDGDGSSEDIFLYRDDHGEPGCEAFLVVGDKGPVHPVTQEGMTLGSGLPNLLGMAQIDGRPGLDVVVRLLAGASTEFVGVFSAASGELERLRVEDSSGSGDLFAYGGGVAHLDAIDCDEEGRVIVSSAVSEDGEGYTYTRTVYGYDGGALVPVETAEVVVAAEDIPDLPEFAGSPFGSCPSA